MTQMKNTSNRNDIKILNIEYLRWPQNKSKCYESQKPLFRSDDIFKVKGEMKFNELIKTWWFIVKANVPDQIYRFLLRENSSDQSK